MDARVVHLHGAPLLVALRRDATLAAAIGTSLALFVTLLLFPAAPWRAALGRVGGVWAPGYALVAAAYPRPRLARLERHALAGAGGLLMAPLVGLATSEIAGFRPTNVSAALLLTTVALATVGAWRGRDAAAEKCARAAVPGTRATLMTCGLAIGLAAVVALPAWFAATSVPSSLALTDMAGNAILPAQFAKDEPFALAIHLGAGTEPRAGRLIVAWDDDTLTPLTLHQEDIVLASGTTHTISVNVPTERPGDHLLRVLWEGEGREVHARIRVADATGEIPRGSA
jgi:hypothetical protein